MKMILVSIIALNLGAPLAAPAFAADARRLKLIASKPA
jgi:hypothetical protein